MVAEEEYMVPFRVATHVGVGLAVRLPLSLGLELPL